MKKKTDKISLCTDCMRVRVLLACDNQYIYVLEYYSMVLKSFVIRKRIDQTLNWFSLHRVRRLHCGITRSAGVAIISILRGRAFLFIFPYSLKLYKESLMILKKFYLRIFGDSKSSYKTKMQNHTIQRNCHVLSSIVD